MQRVYDTVIFSVSDKHLSSTLMQNNLTSLPGFKTTAHTEIDRLYKDQLHV